jgi:hypothetical protein
MNKQEAVSRLVSLLEPRDERERDRLTAYHSRRSREQVMETLSRQLAIGRVTTAEIRRHCQVYPLGMPWR